MKAILHFLYSISCVMVPCLIYQRLSLKKTEVSISKKHWLWVYVFLIYIYLALRATGTGSIWDIGEYESISSTAGINLIPFQSKGYAAYLLNVILFVPFGFLLPRIWTRFRNIGNVIGMGAGFSLAIELCQLSNHRSTDIDDLSMNTLGAFIGYCIWLGFSKWFNSKKPGQYEKLSEYEAEIYVILAVLGDFFLFNWRLLI